MADNGPGGREVGRVSLRVLPDTSRFLPSLKKYAERVERTVVVRLGAQVDARGLEADVQRITRTVEAAAPTIRVPAAPVTDGFARDLQTQVRAAARAIEANIPLTADGEKFRRQVMVDIARLETEIQRFDIEVPLDVEGAARARAELKARVVELQALARLNEVEIPVSVGSSGLSGLGGVLNPAALAGLASVAAVLAGGTIAALPAIVASIAAPVAAIALGFEGIKTAAEVAKPAFDALRQVLSNAFAQELAPVFATLGEVLPKLAPSLERIAVALSTSLGTIVDQIASPEGMAALQGILDGIATAMEILAPALGPLTQIFLDFANTGMQAFVDSAPAMRDLLIDLTGLFTFLNDSGVLRLAADGFTTFATAVTLAIAGTSAIVIAMSAVVGVFGKIVGAVFDFALKVTVAGAKLVAGIVSAVGGAVAAVRTLPGRVTSALTGLGSTLFGAGAALIQGLVDGILSKLGPVGEAVGRVAQVIKDHFPGSPVKDGPLTSWNGGGAGRRLGDLLASGLDSSRETVRSASAGLAGAVVQPALTGAGVLSSSDAGFSGLDYYLLEEAVASGASKARPSVSIRQVESARADYVAQRGVR